MEIKQACTLCLYYMAACMMSLLQVGSAARNRPLYCGACLALVEEMNWQIALVDPKKKIQVGSFRIDSHGNQGTHEVPLARSDVQIHEFLDNVCLEMQHYAESTDKNGNSNFIRNAARDGQRISLKNVKISGEQQDSLRYACDIILEEHEDTFFHMLKNAKTGTEDDKINLEFCVNVVGYCNAKNTTDHMWAYAEAVMAGLTERSKNEDSWEERFGKKEEKVEENEDVEDEEDADDEDGEDDEEDNVDGTSSDKDAQKKEDKSTIDQSSSQSKEEL